LEKEYKRKKPCAGAISVPRMSAAAVVPAAPAAA